MKLSGLVSLALVGGLAVAQGWVDRSVANGPAPRYYHAMCYDPIRNYILMSGGVAPGASQHESWSWDGSTWTYRGPAPHNFSALVFHAGAGKLLGITGTASIGSNSITSYEWDGSNWVNPLSVNMLGPYVGGRLGLCAAYDPIRAQVLVQQTWNESNWNPNWGIARFDGTNWTAAFPLSGNHPAQSMAWNPATSRIAMTYNDLDAVVSGGQTFSRQTSRLVEWTGLAWSPRAVAQTPSRAGAMSADLARGVLITFDEIVQSSQNNSGTPYHSWMLGSGGWDQLVTESFPGARTSHAMAYDPVRNVTVLFGGLNQWSSPMGDTWELTLGTPASFTGYGTGCPGSRGVPQLFAINNDIPRTGSLFEAQVNNLPWNAPTFLLFGLSNTNSSGLPLPFDLSVAGAPGCTLLTSIDNILPLTNVLGSAVWSLQMPHLPGASFYLQAVPFETSANSLGVALSNGGHGLLGL